MNFNGKICYYKGRIQQLSGAVIVTRWRLKSSISPTKGKQQEPGGDLISLYHAALRNQAAFVKKNGLIDRKVIKD